MILKSYKATFLVASAALALAACGDSSTELASPGLVGPNPGTGGGTAAAPAPAPSPQPVPVSSGPCPAGTDNVTVNNTTFCRLSGTITDDITLVAGNTYQLSNQVVIGIDTGADGTAANGDTATLTIEPGVTIFGADTGATLVVSRGSQIIADGELNDPIIFTSAFDLGLGDSLGLPLTPARQQGFSGPVLEEPFTSEWGGIQINGRATINTCDGSGICESEGEGDSGLYGGNDDEDNSGILRFVQIRYAGNVLTTTDELNGIAFQGVGRGTVLENIQVHNGADDGIEFFGGTVNIRNAVITGADDDSLDWTFGWRGRGQNILIIHNPNQPNSDQGIEADNNGGGNDFLPRANPILSNVTIVGAQPGVSDIGILLREGTSASIFNTVVTNFEDCIDIDGTASFQQFNAGEIVFGSTYLSCSADLVATDSDNGDNGFDTQAFLALDPNNAVGPNTLSSLFINGAQENSVTATDVAALDSFFTNTNTIGAVSSAESNFTSGWTIGLNPVPSCPSGTADNGNGGCVLSGTFRNDVRLAAGLDYFLDGQVLIGVDMGPDPLNPLSSGDPAILTIDAGVTIQALSRGATLVVTRGSEIRSNGTAQAPVIFTALNPETVDVNTGVSLWGGIQINGRATINTCNGIGICESEGEGDSGTYGGNDDEDSSGQIFFTRIDYAGNVLTSTDELNGLALQGVGRGTVLDFIQVHNNADDGIEFFGGTADIRHAVITGADDDSLDWTFGWRGNAQFILIAHNINQPNSDQGIEADNNGGGNDFLPRANPALSNMTIIGAQPAVSDIGILLREGTAATILNTVISNFEDCIDIDGTSSFQQFAAGATNIRSTLLSCGANDAIATDGDNGDNGFDDAAFLALDANNRIGASSLRPRTAGGAFGYINGDAEAAITVTDPTALNGFFGSVGQIGAVPNDQADWTVGWTIYLDR